MATCAVTGQLLQPNGEALLSVDVSARVANPVLSGTALITPAEISAETDSSGNFVLTLQQSISVIFTVQFPPIGTEPMRTYSYSANIPATTTANFSDVIVMEV
jgi:hypothetical protein